MNKTKIPALIQHLGSLFVATLCGITLTVPPLFKEKAAEAQKVKGIQIVNAGARIQLWTLRGTFYPGLLTESLSGTQPPGDTYA